MKPPHIATSDGRLTKLENNYGALIAWLEVKFDAMDARFDAMERKLDVIIEHLKIVP